MSAQPHEAAATDEAADFADDEAILAAVRAGAGVSHEAVRSWLLSKDTATPLPRPQPGD